MPTVGLLGSVIPALVCASLAAAATVGAVATGILIGRAASGDDTPVDSDPAWSGLDRLRALTDRDRNRNVGCGCGDGRRSG